MTAILLAEICVFCTGLQALAVNHSSVPSVNLGNTASLFGLFHAIIYHRRAQPPQYWSFVGGLPGAEGLGTFKCVCTHCPTLSWFPVVNPSRGSNHPVMGFDSIFASWGMKRDVLFDFPDNTYSKETVVEQFELHTSITGGGKGILFCNLTSLPAVLLTGRREEEFPSRKSFQPGLK